MGSNSLMVEAKNQVWGAKEKAPQTHIQVKGALSAALP
jgi:hypothetical protein